jgi:hypothetical protein
MRVSISGKTECALRSDCRLGWNTYDNRWIPNFFRLEENKINPVERK